jgi:hypothetical protein
MIVFLFSLGISFVLIKFSPSSYSESAENRLLRRVMLWLAFLVFVVGATSLVFAVHDFFSQRAVVIKPTRIF